MLTCARLLFENPSLTHVGIDADDTLWYDSRYFRRLEEAYYSAAQSEEISRSASAEQLRLQLLASQHGEGGFADAVQRASLSLGFQRQLAMVNAAIADFRTHPLEVLPEAMATVARLRRAFHITILTKGDLLEQRRKVRQSGVPHDLLKILTSKSVATLSKLLSNLGVAPGNFLSIGNSVRHDIVPAIACGAAAIWLNHSENFHGRNQDCPAAACEIGGWPELASVLSVP